MKEKETALNEALREYQHQRPFTKFWQWCVLTDRYENFTEEEKRESKLISKTLKV